MTELNHSLNLDGATSFAWTKYRLRVSGMAGAFAFSAANFLLAFSLQRLSSPAEFGTYALLQVMLQFGMSISNALFCSPVVVALSEGAELSVTQSFLKANSVVCFMCAILVGGAAWLLSGSPAFAVAGAVLCFLSWMRWFFRSVELASRNFRDPARADMIYAVVVGAPALWLLFRGGDDVALALWIQAIGCAAAFCSLGKVAARELAGLLSASTAPFYRSLRAHGSWALLGVITTEATANSHAWMIGLMLGPAVYAPIAAISLFFRPVLIVTQSLTQYERPRMAAAITSGLRAELEQHRRVFLNISLLCWAGNGVVVACILLWAPRLVGNGQYSMATLWAVSGMIFITYLARVLRGAESTALQAGGYFRPLAMVTVVTSPVAVLGVVATALLAPSNAALLVSGVFIAEAVSCGLIRRNYRRVFVPWVGSVQS